MADDETIAQFTNVTDANPGKAQQYLKLADGNIEQALELYFANDGADLEASAASTTAAQPSQAPPLPGPQTRPSRTRRTYEDDDGVVHLDSDKEEDDLDQDMDIDEGEPGLLPPGGTSGSIPSTAGHPPASASGRSQLGGSSAEDDEAMARRLQEEFYGTGAAGGAAASTDVLDEHGVRAPLARTTETLVGPDSYGLPGDGEDTHSAILAQVRAREQARRARTRGSAGIFNQNTSESIWNAPSAEESSSSDHRTRLARATGGASETSFKNRTLAEMFRPPFEIMSRLKWEDAREEGKENEKWLLVDIQQPGDFHCQALNRDIWKNPGVKETVQENFIFMQFAREDPSAARYLQYYFPDNEDTASYPHIAIVDPRTGEQVKKWSGLPGPSPADFLMQLHEFLDRYSLKSSAKNPVAKRKPEPKKETQIEKMTEEQQLEMAMQNSLAAGHASNGTAKNEDPDELTRSGVLPSSIAAGTPNGDSHPTDHDLEPTGSAPTESPSSTLFSSISSTTPHTEPSPSSPSTRIQFRHPAGRPIVRRFALQDPVRRLFEWLKAEPIEGKEGIEFGLVSMGKNLLGCLDETIEEAGLRNSSVMVEFVEG